MLSLKTVKDYPLKEIFYGKFHTNITLMPKVSLMQIRNHYPEYIENDSKKIEKSLISPFHIALNTINEKMWFLNDDDDDNSEDKDKARDRAMTNFHDTLRLKNTIVSSGRINFPFLIY